MEYENDYSWAKQYLDPGESVQWYGRPRRFSPFTRSDLIEIPVNLVALGFFAFWEWAVVKHLPSSTDNTLLFFVGTLFKLIGLAFMLTALYQAFGRLLRRRFLLKRTSYVITNRKILRSQKQKVDLLQGDALRNYHILEHRDGLKSIVFDNTAQKRRHSFGRWDFELAFLPDAERALRAINTICSASAQQ